MIACRECQKPFPAGSFPHRCPDCGGVYGFASGLTLAASGREDDQPGIWRYRSSFGLPPQAQPVSLGEGNTPLVWGEITGKRLAFKLESQNPTGSFKDRGSAVLVSHLLAADVREAVEDSSGNAGASFAAYAARGGIKARIYVPSSAAGPKLQQIESYGAEVVPVPGPRSKAADAVMDQVKRGAVYASHAYLPHGTAGIAAIAYELVEELGSAPGAVILPVGHGSLLLGLALGFNALLAAGRIQCLPRLVGVQAASCAPLYAAYQKGADVPEAGPEGITAASGVAISNPYHGKWILAALRESGGCILAVDEERIKSGQEAMARMGVYAEMTSALVYDACRQLVGELPEPVVCIVTGHGLKNG